MGKEGRGPPPGGLWAYAYDVTLPDREDRLSSIQGLLDREHKEAKDGARTWAGRVVVEPEIMRILVVSDSPAQDRDVNLRLAVKLKELKAKFVITVPLAVVDDVASGSGNGRLRGSAP